MLQLLDSSAIGGSQFSGSLPNCYKWWIPRLQALNSSNWFPYDQQLHEKKDSLPRGRERFPGSSVFYLGQAARIQTRLLPPWLVSVRDALHLALLSPHHFAPWPCVLLNLQGMPRLLRANPRGSPAPSHTPLLCSVPAPLHPGSCPALPCPAGSLPAALLPHLTCQHSWIAPAPQTKGWKLIGSRIYSDYCQPSLSIWTTLRIK